MAICADGNLAAADRDLAAAWQSVLAPLDAETATVLRADQKKFLQGLDEGFDSDVWGKAGPPPQKDMRAQIARLPHDGDDSPFPALEDELRERIGFLRALTPAASGVPFDGLWKNYDAELLIEPAGEGRYDVTFGLTSYGFDRDHCHFNATFAAAEAGLAARAVHNTDPEQDNHDIAGRLRIARAGTALTLSQADPDQTPGAGERWVCPRVPALTGPLFHTGLKADEASRLQPDEE